MKRVCSTKTNPNSPENKAKKHELPDYTRFISVPFGFEAYPLQNQGELYESASPLMNPYILEMIFSFVPSPGLQNARSVCRMWNTEIQRFVHNAKKLRIYGKNEKPAVNFLELKSKGNMSRLLELWWSDDLCSNPNFQKILLNHGHFLSTLILQNCELNVNSLLDLMKYDPFPYLTSLCLNRNSYVDPAGRQTLFIIDDESRPILKNLQKLEINERGSDSHTTLRNIAIICPNLKILMYGNCPKPVLSEFKSKEYNPKLSSLVSLQLAPMDGERMTFHYFEALMSLKISKLKTIFLYGMDIGGNKRMASLNKFLRTVSTTLESLHFGQRILAHPEYKPRASSPFPVYLPSLKRISVGPGYIHSMSVLEDMPNLCSFTCTRTVSGDWDKVVDKGVPLSPHTSVKSLDLGDINHIPLTKLSSSFPNVTKLELNLSRVGNHNEVVRALFGGFPKLQTFSIYDLFTQNRLTDEAITGLPETAYDKEDFDPDTDRKLPYIGNLKCLIDLRLQYLSGQLTDKSVLYGIKDIPALYALDLSNSQITDLSLDVLGKSMPTLTMLYIRNCRNLSSAGIRRFRESGNKAELRVDITEVESLHVKHFLLPT